MFIKTTTTTFIFACLTSLINAADQKSFLIQLVDGLNAASLLLEAPDDPLLKMLRPFVKDTITIGTFNCLVAELEPTLALGVRFSTRVKKVYENHYVKIVDTPVAPQPEVLEQSTQSPADEVLKVQIEDPSILLLDQPQRNITESDQLKVKGVQDDAPSHLARINRREGLYDTKLPYVYDYPFTGADVYAYVLDTGVAVDHPDFEGRATHGASFIPYEPPTDLNGHGTHVAGLVGSKTYGAAKSVNIIAVKGLDGKGRGTASSIMKGMEWAAKDRSEKGVKGVLNMSVGGFYSSILNDATDAVKRTGMSVVVAAGNEKQSASLYSPSSAPGAIAIGAMDDKKDVVAWFSNFGEVVAVFAPGVEIFSLNAKSYEQPILYSGTSMSSPIVAGVVACYLEEGITVDEMKMTVIERSTKLAMSRSIRRSWRYYSTKDQLVYYGSDYDAEKVTVKHGSPYNGEDISSQTIVPSFGQFSESEHAIKELSYQLI